MASTQTHQIRRQVVELVGCRRDEAAALQAAAARLSQRDWSPLIDRLCSAHVDAERVLRIDRLQVDLGQVPVGVWLAAAAADGSGAGEAAADARALARQFETAFEARLIEALQAASEVQTDGELLDCFLQTGALPWWADVADRTCVARAALALANQPPAAWRHRLGQPGALTLDGVRLGRLVDALTESQRAAVLQTWLTAAGGDQAECWTPRQQVSWQTAIARAAPALGQSAEVWLRTWWRAALATVLWPDANGMGWGAMLQRWLASLDQPDGAVRPALRRALDEAMPHAGVDADALPALWRALTRPPGSAAPPVTTAPPATPVGPVPPESPALPALRALAAPTEVDDAWQALLAALGHLAASDAGDSAVWRHWHERLAGAAPGGDSARRMPPGPVPASASERRVPGTSQPMHRLPAALLERVAAAWRSGGRDDLVSALQAVLLAAQTQGLVDPLAAGIAAGAAQIQERAAAWSTALRQAPGQHRPGPHSDVETLYVHNAGLVLLWPFVQRFADRQGLLQPGKPVRWRDGAAAQRAAVLLHCAISGDAEPPEFQLLLPKLMCGLDLDAPLQLHRALSADEQAECEALLVAAIAQAPILRQMSVAGFRGSFGLRAGQLCSRDGHWLLQVERQTFDVVIDRFPWSIALIRLPWMQALLQVQW